MALSGRIPERCGTGGRCSGAGTVGHGNPPVEQGLMNVRNSTMLGIAAMAHKGHDIKAKLMLRQSFA